KKVDDAARILNLTDYLERRPSQLSGGQRQRVAMGRAIVRQPKAFLFDEPLSNLDARLREQMRAEIKRMHADLGATSVYVTHDQIEAMTLASRIVAMNAGHVQQIGAPLDLYDRPANLFVAGFIGSPGMNFLEGRLGRENGGSFVVLGDGTRLELGRDVKLADGEPVTLGIRPEHVTVSPADGAVEATVDLVEPTGLGIILHLTVHGLPFKLFSSDRALLQPGKSLRVGFPQERLHVFDRDGVRIGEA
ncbi:TOBE domain-containing protein, partial [Agrobacterium tumefaciens]|uniref:ABC transporter ATP-binding protein n=1 Tax=Agrobacterium tumefaciens TaxID=358 RepID=UPI00157358A9